MRRPGNRLTNQGPERVEGETQPACGESGDFLEIGTNTYSYATRAIFCDPGTGHLVPASVEIVVSEGSVMIWLKT